MQRHSRRPPGLLVPGPGRRGHRPPHRNHRGHGDRRQAAPATGEVPRARRLAMRLLYPRVPDGGKVSAGHEPRSDRGTNPLRAGRQPLPLHRLRQDRACRSGRRPRDEGSITMGFDPSYSVRKFTSVGTRPVRPDGVDKVTGRARYGADFNMPGQLVGRILRSPHAHARIRRIDTSKAEQLKGVKAVITAADLPDLTNGDSSMFDILDNCMARTKVDYEVLPHVTDVDAAMQASAPLLHETVFTGGIDPKPTAPSNITNRTQYGHGDVEAGFKEADAVVERSFKTEQSHQAYIEPHACVASVNSDGTSEMWVCTQGHFVYRQQCAALLGLDVSKLRVTSSEIGGGFGGKTHIWAEPIALALSRKAGRPVKLVMSRE